MRKTKTERAQTTKRGEKIAARTEEPRQKKHNENKNQKYFSTAEALLNIFIRFQSALGSLMSTFQFTRSDERGGGGSESEVRHQRFASVRLRASRIRCSE